MPTARGSSSTSVSFLQNSIGRNIDAMFNMGLVSLSLLLKQTSDGRVNLSMSLVYFGRSNAGMGRLRF